jgi:hypothetical protein
MGNLAAPARPLGITPVRAVMPTMTGYRTQHWVTRSSACSPWTTGGPVPVKTAGKLMDQGAKLIGALRPAGSLWHAQSLFCTKGKAVANAPLPLNFAVADYPHTRTILSGHIPIEGIASNVIKVEPQIAALRI